MKNLKTSLAILALVAALTSCGKKGDPTPADKTPKDFTGYYVAAKFTLTQGGKTSSVPLVIFMKPNNSAFLMAGDGESFNGSYNYENNHLLFKLGVNVDVTLDGATATNLTISNTTITQFSLEKIPDASVFNGSFAGSMNSTVSKTAVELLFLKNITFTKDLYGFGASSGSTNTTLSYTLTNNAVATSNTGNNGVLSFFMMMKGKLEITRVTPNVNDNVFDFGTYAKQ